MLRFGDDIGKTAGIHTLNFPVKDAQLPKGIYFIRMHAGDESITRKLILE